MPKELFPRFNKEKDKKVAKAVLADAALSKTGSNSLLDDIKYIPNPIRRKNSQLNLGLKETPPAASSFEKKILTIPIIPDSVVSTLLEILIDKHPDINVGSIVGGGNVPYLAFGVSNTMVRKIFSNPILEVLDIVEPARDVKKGIDLEADGLLEEGVTESSYVRYLQKRMKEIDQLSWEQREYRDNDDEELEDKDDERERHILDNLLKQGIQPLSDEKIEEILIGIINKELKNRSSK